MHRAIQKADVLLEALPYLRSFAGKTFVIKYGGSIMETAEGEESVVLDVLFLHTAGIWPVVVHGGGREISEAQKRTGRQPRFVQGLRVTDARTMRVTAGVLGRVNRRIVARLERHGDLCVGFSGRRGAVIRARKLVLPGAGRREDLGFVGTVAGFDLDPLALARRRGQIPVLSSVAVGARGVQYNVNADDVAGALAARLRAAKLILMTDVAGIKDGQGELLSSLSRGRAAALIRSGVIARGMIPKVRACLAALERGVRKAHVIDGRLRHSLLLEIFTSKGVGTEIVG